MNISPTELHLTSENDADFREYDLTEEQQPTLNRNDSFVYASSSLVAALKAKSQEKVRIQEKNLQEWSQKDAKFRWDLFCRFATKEIIPSDFRYTRIEQSDQTINLANANWQVLKKSLISKYDALKLASRLYTLTRPINLRSQALRIELELILVGECQFNIVSRSSGLSNEETAVIRFTKFETFDSHRLFLMFGVLDKESKEMVLLRKIEIPVYKQVDDQMHVSVSIVDNGNDIIAVSGTVNRNMRNNFRAVCDKIFVPNFEDFNLFFYGLGTNVMMKTFRLEVIDRMDNGTFTKRGTTQECYSCCKIF